MVTAELQKNVAKLHDYFFADLQAFVACSKNTREDNGIHRRQHMLYT
jgi:hypothetical protein